MTLPHILQGLLSFSITTPSPDSSHPGPCLLPQPGPRLPRDSPGLICAPPQSATFHTHSIPEADSCGSP